MKQLLLFAITFLSFFVANAADTSTVNVIVPVGQTIKSDSLKVVDAITNNEISATVTGVSIQNSSPSIATVSYLSRTISVMRVAPGSGTAILSCRVSYTDPGDGLQKSEDKVIIINYTIAGTPHGVTLQVFD